MGNTSSSRMSIPFSRTENHPFIPSSSHSCQHNVLIHLNRSRKHRTEEGMVVEEWSMDTFNFFTSTTKILAVSTLSPSNLLTIARLVPTLSFPNPSLFVATPSLQSQLNNESPHSDIDPRSSFDTMHQSEQKGM